MLRALAQSWLDPLTHRLATRIRYRVLAAAGAAVAIIAATGLIGLHYVNAVARSVSVSAEQTSPLLSRALAASEATRRLVASAYDIDRTCAMEAGSGAQEAQSSWTGEFAHIRDLQEVARRAGLGERARSLTEIGGKLFNTLWSITLFCGETQQTVVLVRQKERATIEAIAQLSAMISNLAVALDAEVSLAEERSKNAAQTGETTDVGRQISQLLLDLWPTLRNLHTLHERAARLEDMVTAPSQSSDAARLEAAIALRMRLLEAMKSLVQATSPRLQALGRNEHATLLHKQFEAIDSQFRGTGGLDDAQFRLQGAKAQVRMMEAGLRGIEQRLTAEMHDLESEARTLDSAAHAETASTITEAMLVIGIIAGISALSTLFAALRFTDRLTRPIEALTAHTKQVQETQDVDHRLPATLTGRRDEIGGLASAFNDMIAALAEAKKRLLEESQAEIRLQLDRLKMAIEGMPQGIYLIGPDKRLLLSNGRFAELYRLTENQLAVGATDAAIVAACEANGAVVASEVVEAIPAREGRDHMISQSVRSLEDGRTMVVTTVPTCDGGAVVVHDDISDRQRAEAEIARITRCDALTGLANRTQFHEQMSEVLARRREDRSVAILYIDLDHFKAINDTLGHPVGDRLLVLASKRLCGCLRDNDVVARMGGDEFAVILDSARGAEEAAALAERIIQSVGQPYDIDGQQAVIGVSIGIAMAPRDGEDTDSLMKNVDLALYRAKRDGRNTHCFFESEMDERVQERRTLEIALRKAIATESLQIHYQPLVNIKTGQVEEFEALLRWHDPVRGQISPEVFIPLAEETNLINEISSWVLKRACSDAASWPSHVRVAVNISPLSFRTRTLPLTVLAALEASGLPPGRLELEITEGILLSDTHSTLQTLSQLQDIGVRIAMDDFGTGYSSLSYLRKFNFDKVKIDRSFVNALDHTKDSRAIIRAVSGLCSTLGIEITAEGVETEDQLHTLREEGCTQVQGYLLGRPGPASSVAGYFDKPAMRMKA